MHNLIQGIGLSGSRFYLAVQIFPNLEITWDFELPWFMTFIFDNLRKSFNYSLYSLPS